MDNNNTNANINANIANEDLSKKLHELEFAAIELNLFLDNNPDNKNALADFNVISRELMSVKKLYEQERGPLVNFGFSEIQYPKGWVNEPWPWEIGE
jgi:spore coat protein JB